MLWLPDNRPAQNLVPELLPTYMYKHTHTRTCPSEVWKVCPHLFVLLALCGRCALSAICPIFVGVGRCAALDLCIHASCLHIMRSGPLYVDCPTCPVLHIMRSGPLYILSYLPFGSAIMCVAPPAIILFLPHAFPLLYIMYLAYFALGSLCPDVSVL